MKKLFSLIVLIFISLSLYALINEDGKVYKGSMNHRNIFIENDLSNLKNIYILGVKDDSVLVATYSPIFKVDTLEINYVDIIIDKDLSNKIINYYKSNTNPNDSIVLFNDDYEDVINIWEYLQYECFDLKKYPTLRESILRKIGDMNIAPNGLMEVLGFSNDENGIIIPEIWYANTSVIPITRFDIEVEYKYKDGKIKRNNFDVKHPYSFIYTSNTKIEPYTYKQLNFKDNNKVKILNTMPDPEPIVKSITVYFNGVRTVKMKEEDLVWDRKAVILPTY